MLVICHSIDLLRLISAACFAYPLLTVLNIGNLFMHFWVCLCFWVVLDRIIIVFLSECVANFVLAVCLYCIVCLCVSGILWMFLFSREGLCLILLCGLDMFLLVVPV